MAQMKAVVDKLLTDVSNGYFPEGYIADQALPLIEVKQNSGLLGKYGGAHLRIEHSLVGGRGQYRRVESIVRSSASYLVESHGLSALVTESDYRNVELPFDAEKDETIGLTALIALGKEKALADTILSTSVLTQNTTLVGADQFSAYTTSDPIGVFKTARLAVWNGSGMVPNTAIMSWEVMNTLAYHPGILDALGYTQNRAGQLSEAELAKAIGVDRLLIGKAKYNSAAEGQSDVLASVWSDDIVIAMLPEKAAKYQKSLGYRVALSGQSQRRVFKESVMNPPNSTEILVDDSYDYLISDVTCGYLIKDVLA